MDDYILNFGTPVHCYDEQCGKLAKLAFRSESRQVTDLVVEEGLLLKRARVFPFSVVRRATNDDIAISVFEEELSNYPEYRETVVETTPEGGSVEPAMVHGSPYGLATSAPTVPMVKQKLIQGVDDNLDLLDKETPVIATDSTVGHIRGLAIVPENGLITHLLVHKGAIFVEEFWLSMAMIERISTKGVFVKMTKAELDELIEYDERRDNNWDHMPTDAALEAVDFDPDPSIDEEEHTMKEMIMNDDASLAVLIADALLDNPQTEDAIIEVINDRGVITLQGTVEDNKTKKAAEEIANNYPSVVSVTNELVVNVQ